MSLEQSLHEKALAAATRFQIAEAELFEILSEMDLKKAYLPLGYSSLYQYIVSSLKLSEGQAYNLIGVARKAREIPLLRTEIQAGNLSVSKARKIVSVLTKENQKEWIEKARSLPQKELERQVAAVNPEVKASERVVYTSEKDLKLSLGISSELLKKLKRAQLLLSQGKRKTLSLEETLDHLTENFLKQKDPLQKAERSVSRKSKPNSSQELLTSNKRIPIPAQTKHQVFLRDQGKCSFRSKEGVTCQSSGYVQIHHRHHVAHGGTNAFQNLQTLCTNHHHWIHSKTESPNSTRPKWKNPS